MTIARIALVAAGAAAVFAATPALAQDADTPPVSTEGTVFDGDWVALGAGAAYGPSYEGSDDYVVSPLPIVQGSLGGVAINPRPAGLALDFIPDRPGQVGINAGIAARANFNRAKQIKDPVVEAYGKLDTAIEVGPSVGIKLPGVLNPYDSLSFNVDALWDIAGAHGGRTINPSVTYFTPLSRGIAASLSLAARNVDDDYADYYYSVPALAGSPLPAFQAEGGFDKMTVGAFTAFDFDGDVTNGGLAAVLIGSYSRMMGDGKRTPFTSMVGSADQWSVVAGIGYTF